MPEKVCRLEFPRGYVESTSPGMRRLYSEMAAAALGRHPALLLGETGVGKEMLSRTVHLSSQRSKGPFVAVNCAAIPPDMLEAEMFGVERGAATGVSRRPGYFARAHRGTLFLDEIGDLHKTLQAKLLRALDSGEVHPVGGSPQRVDVRILSATNVGLERRVEAGEFRPDLFYRLSAFILRVPPLRQRPEDVPGLARHILTEMSQETGLCLSGVTWRGLERLTAHPWPGNVRQLQHALRQAAQRVPPGQALDAIHLEASLGLRRGGPQRAETPTGPRGGAEVAAEELNLKKRLAELERRVVAKALEQAKGNRTHTAKKLGISRNTLATKIALYGLS